MSYEDKLGARLIILEGNISAGKTTLVKSLGETLGARTFLEPTVANPYLDKFYKEPKKYALKLQLWLFRQRYHTYLASIKYIQETGKTAILDRSVYSDWVFAEKNRLDGNISEEGFAYYEALRAQLLAALPLPHFTLYLDVTPEECYRRVHTLRKRDCEAGIPLEYLSGLHHCYDTLVESMRRQGSCTVRVPWEKFGHPSEVAAALLHHVTHAQQAMLPFSVELDVEALRHPFLKPELRRLSHRFEDDIFSDYSPDIEKLHDEGDEVASSVSSEVVTSALAHTAADSGEIASGISNTPPTSSGATASTTTKRKADRSRALSDEERACSSSKGKSESLQSLSSHDEQDPEELGYGPMPGVRKTSGVRLVQPPK